MAEEKPKNVVETAPEAVKDVGGEKMVKPPPPPHDENPDNSKALVIVENIDPKEKITGGSKDRDAALTRLETEKKLSMIRAWEENEKTKAENKAAKKLSAILAWENAKKASIEAQLRKKEEDLEKKKAEYAEKMKNKIALIHKAAEEKRALVEAKRGEEILEAEEQAAKYRATGLAPKKLLSCFGP